MALTFSAGGLGDATFAASSGALVALAAAKAAEAKAAEAARPSPAALLLYRWLPVSAGVVVGALGAAALMRRGRRR